MKKNLLAVVFLLCVFANGVYGFDYIYIEIDGARQLDISEIKSLTEFQKIDDYESYLNSYVQGCLDKGSGGSASIPCHIKHRVWPREVDVLYEKVFNASDDSGSKAMKEARYAWKIYRHKSLELANQIIKNKYMSAPGTMYSLLAAQDSDDIHSQLLKERIQMLWSMMQLQSSITDHRD